MDFKQDALQAQMVLNRMSEIIESPLPSTVNISRNSALNYSSSSDQLDNSRELAADEDNNIEVGPKCINYSWNYFIITNSLLKY